MYAIIRAGGKQSKVRPGDLIDVERLKGAGESVEFTPLLVVDDQGTTITDRATLSGIKVHGRVVGESSGPKIDIFKYQNKTGYRRSAGHRQRYTTVQVTSIDLPGQGDADQPAATSEES